MKSYPKPVQKQSNVLTVARYEYTVWEKRIIYAVIGQINKQLKTGVSETDLFDNRIIRMTANELLNGDMGNLREAKKAANSLRMKPYEIVRNPNSRKQSWENFGFISSSKIEYGYIEVEISRLLMPYLIDLTKNFTRYSPATAMILRSGYSQRFYELCCQWRDTGYWSKSVDELRDMLKLEGKYKTYGELKKYVLETARKELEELYISNDSDVYFIYKEIKTGKAVTRLEFSVKNKEKNKGSIESTSDEREFVLRTIKMFWPDEPHSSEKEALYRDQKRIKIFNTLSEAKGFKEFIDLAARIIKNYPGKPASELRAILTQVLKDDFGITV